jgi:hypothetical protein
VHNILEFLLDLVGVLDVPLDDHPEDLCAGPELRAYMCVTIAEPQAAVVPRNDGVLTFACADSRLTDSHGRHSGGALLRLNSLLVRPRSWDESEESTHGTTSFGLFHTLLCFLRCGPTLIHSLHLVTVTNTLYAEWYKRSAFLHHYISNYWASVLYGQQIKPKNRCWHMLSTDCTSPLQTHCK